MQTCYIYAELGVGLRFVTLDSTPAIYVPRLRSRSVSLRLQVPKSGRFRVEGCMYLYLGSI